MTRVLAQLPNTTGSPAQRQKQVERLCKKFETWWLKNSGKTEMIDYSTTNWNEFFNRKYPGIPIEVKNNADLGGFCQGSVDPITDGARKMVTGFVLSFDPFFAGVLRCVTPPHEHFHIAHLIKNPKILARISIVKEMFNKNRLLEINKFYSDSLYHNDSTKNATMLSEERSVNIKNHIQQFFEKENFSSDEKINILQRWRYFIESEIGANKQGVKTGIKMAYKYMQRAIETGKNFYLGNTILDFAKIPEKDRLKKGCAFACKNINSTSHSDVEFYPQKYQILNEMLAEEIKNHRAKHAADLRAKVKRS